MAESRCSLTPITSLIRAGQGWRERISGQIVAGGGPREWSERGRWSRTRALRDGPVTDRVHSRAVLQGRKQMDTRSRSGFVGLGASYLCFPRSQSGHNDGRFVCYDCHNMCLNKAHNSDEFLTAFHERQNRYRHDYNIVPTQPLQFPRASSPAIDG